MCAFLKLLRKDRPIKVGELWVIRGDKYPPAVAGIPIKVVQVGKKKVKYELGKNTYSMYKRYFTKIYTPLE